MRIHVAVCVSAEARPCVCGSLKSTSGDFLSQPPTPTCVLRQDLLLNPELTNSLRPASELQESALLLFPSWDNRYLPRSPAFYKGARDPNSSPLACTAHSLSTQPFPLSWSWLDMTEPYRDWAVAIPFTCVNIWQLTVYPISPLRGPYSTFLKIMEGDLWEQAATYPSIALAFI